jgi:hypothetical protein
MWAGKNSGMHMNVPYTTPLQDASQSSFVYAGKIKVRYFLKSGLYAEMEISKPSDPFIFALELGKYHNG